MLSTCSCIPAPEPGTYAALSECLFNQSLTRTQEAQPRSSRSSLCRERASEKGVVTVLCSIVPGRPPPVQPALGTLQQLDLFSPLMRWNSEFWSLLPQIPPHFLGCACDHKVLELQISNHRFQSPVHACLQDSAGRWGLGRFSYPSLRQSVSMEKL